MTDPNMTDEEMRAEVPAIARPYVAERDKTIAKIEGQTQETMRATGMTREEIEAAIPEHPSRRESPVADGPIATRFDAMDLCKCGHVRRVHEHGVCLACASTCPSDRKALPTHEFTQNPNQFARAFTAAREADASEEPDVSGAFLNAQRSAADHLHAAQLGARAHVVPHIRAASEAAAAEGDPELAAACDYFAALVNGDLDPAILKYGAAVLRFVRGIGP